MVSLTKSVGLAVTLAAATVSAIPSGLTAIILSSSTDYGCLDIDASYTPEAQNTKCPKLFKFASSGGDQVTISTERGPCAIVDDVMWCSAELTASKFNFDGKTQVLSIGSGFSIDDAAQGAYLVPVFNDKTHKHNITLLAGTDS